MGRGCLLAFVVLALLLVVAVRARLLAARPEVVWLLGALPVAALLGGARTPAVVVLALAELAALVPLHGFVTLLRAARLEGG